MTKAKNPTKEQLENARARERAYAERNREYVRAFLKDNPCVLCGYSDIRALEFDHIDPMKKRFKISRIIQRGNSIKCLQTEMDKCQVLCSNCHRIKTYEEKDYLVKRPTEG